MGEEDSLRDVYYFNDPVDKYGYSTNCRVYICVKLLQLSASAGFLSELIR